jgi:hypothetical protein
MTQPTDTLTLKEAYLATYALLVSLYYRTSSDELGSLLGDLGLLADGTTADPAAWGDWLQCVEKARSGKVDARFVLTPPDISHGS